MVCQMEGLLVRMKARRKGIKEVNESVHGKMDVDKN